MNFELHALCGSDCHTCQHVHSELEAMIMQPVVLVVIVMSKAHFDKTVMQPKKGVYVKGIDLKLPGWLKALAHRSPKTDLHSVATMIRKLEQWEK